MNVGGGGALDLCVFRREAPCCEPGLDLCEIPDHASRRQVESFRKFPAALHLVDRRIGHQLRSAFVINRRVVGTVIGREARSALADQPFPALHAEVSQRIVFADSVAAGRLACEVAPNSAAAREIAALAQAVREMLR